MIVPECIRKWLLASVERVMESRPPDFTIGSKDDPYMHRWYAIPRNRFVNVYLHRFVRDDNDEALHDHPWVNVSVILDGDYDEVVMANADDFTVVDKRNPALRYRVVARAQGQVVARRPTAAHRIVLRKRKVGGQPMQVVSLFLTEPVVRMWGFHCPKGWIPFKQFADVDARSSVAGKGCP